MSHTPHQSDRRQTAAIGIEREKESAVFPSPVRSGLGYLQRYRSDSEPTISLGPICRVSIYYLDRDPIEFVSGTPLSQSRIHVLTNPCLSRPPILLRHILITAEQFRFVP